MDPVKGTPAEVIEVTRSVSHCCTVEGWQSVNGMRLRGHGDPAHRGGCWPADPGTGAVGHIYCSILPDGEMQRTAIHELTHHVTMITGRNAVEKLCRRSRTDGNPNEPIPGDPEDPVYRAGRWATASIGSQYDEMSFEVMRTGVEGLHTNEGFDMGSDPDHQAFVLGALEAL